MSYIVVFGFITDFKSLPANELRARAPNLVASYPADLEPSFVDEFVQFTFLVMTEKDQSVVHISFRFRYLYSAPSRFLLRGAPDTESRTLNRSFTPKRMSNCE